MNKEVIKEIELSLFHSNIELICYKKEAISNEEYYLLDAIRFELYDRKYSKRKTIYLPENDCKDISSIVNFLIYNCRKQFEKVFFDEVIESKMN